MQNDLKLHQERFGLAIRKNFFTDRVPNTGTGYAGQRWNPHPWGDLKDKMWCGGTTSLTDRLGQ